MRYMFLQCLRLGKNPYSGIMWKQGVWHWGLWQLPVVSADTASRIMHLWWRSAPNLDNINRLNGNVDITALYQSGCFIYGGIAVY